ncbi:hypothetical protein Tco_0268781 [Tanacetum coccineum]
MEAQRFNVETPVLGSQNNKFDPKLENVRVVYKVFDDMPKENFEVVYKVNEEMPHGNVMLKHQLLKDANVTRNDKDIEKLEYKDIIEEKYESTEVKNDVVPNVVKALVEIIGYQMMETHNGWREDICQVDKDSYEQNYNSVAYKHKGIALGLGINLSGIRSFSLRKFNLEDMELESTNSGPTTKLPILKLGEYEMWVIRIKQYFQIQDYALWEVIKNGNSWVSVSQTSQENGITVTKMSTPTTAEEKTNKKNDVKLPRKLSLKLQFENQAATNLNLKLLSSLPPEWNTHTVVWMNKPEVETMSIDDLYNNFKIVEQKVKKTVVSAASPSVNTASPQVCTASVSDNTVYAFMLSLLKCESIEVTIRGSGIMIVINGNDIVGYDKSKVKCYNCHKLGTLLPGNACSTKQARKRQFIPPHPLIYNRPKKLDLSYSGLDEFKEPEFKGYGPENSKKESNVVCEKESDNSKENSDKSLVKETCIYRTKENNGAHSIKDWVSDDEEQDESKPKSEKKFVIPTAKKEFTKPKNHEKPVKKQVRNMSPKVVLLKTGLTPVNIVRPVNNAHLKTAVYSLVVKVMFAFALGDAYGGKIYWGLANTELVYTSTLFTTKRLLILVNQSTADDDQKQVEDGLNNENAEQVSSLKLNVVGPSVSVASPNKEDSTEEEPECSSTVRLRRMSNPTSEQGFLSMKKNQQALLKLYLIHPGWKQCRKNFCNSNFNKFGYWWISLMERRPLVTNGLQNKKDEWGIHDIGIKPRSIVDGTFSLGSQKQGVYVLVQQKQDGIFISQDKYVAEILKKFNYFDVKTALTPFDLEKPLVKDGDADDVDVHLYRSMIGSLMYLTASRPDIMFACKKQTVVATSRTEAEYVNAASCCGQIFLQKVLMQADFNTWSQVLEC